MDGRRSALIVASDSYTDPGLQRLRAPATDAQALAGVLREPDIGGFEVRTLLNEPAHEVSLAVEEFFADRRPDDLLLLHFSCHGVKDEGGELYFAAANTRLRRLAATAVAAEFVNRRMGRSRSRRVVLLLDCCYAGAFERGMTARAGSGMDIEEQFGGRGRAVITASSAMEYAFEGDELADARDLAPSVFTSALVEGLETGEADRDQDGLVALDELYDYVYDRVRAVTPNQTPGKWTFGVQGELVIARRSRPVTTPAPLPPELQEAADSPFAGVRAGVVPELARLLRSRHAGLALAARRTLERLADDDSRATSAAALTALAAAPSPPPAPPQPVVEAAQSGQVVEAARPEPVVEASSSGPPAEAAPTQPADAPARSATAEAAEPVDAPPPAPEVAATPSRAGETQTPTAPVAEPSTAEPVATGSRAADPAGSQAKSAATGTAAGAPAGERPLQEAGTQPLQDAGTRPLQEAGRQPLQDAAERPLQEAGTRPHEEAGERPFQVAGERPLQVAGWLAIAGAVLMGFGLLLPYQWDSPLLDDQDTFALGIVLTAVLGLGAGIGTLLPATRRLVGPAMLLGVAAASTRGLVQLLTEQLRDSGGYGAGYGVEIAAHLVLLAGACVAGVALARSGEVQLRPPPRKLGLPQAIVLLGIAGTVALVVVDRRVLELGSAWYWEITPIWLTVLAFLVPAAAAVAAPRRFGTWLLVGWVGGAGAVFAEYYVWTTRQISEGDYDIGRSALLVFAVTLLGLLVAAVLHARGEQAPTVPPVGQR
jgi:Caspase domain